MKKLLLSTVAIAMLSTAASAADLDAAPEPVLEAWAGWYAGLNLGYGFSNAPGLGISNDYDFFEGPSNGSSSSRSFGDFSDRRLNLDADGGFGGGQVGFNWQRDEFIYGLEGDFQFSDIDGNIKRRGDRFLSKVSTPAAQDAPSNGNGIYGGRTSARQQLKWFSTVRGRVGVAPTDYLMFYATAGVAFGKIKNSVNIENDMYSPVQVYGYGYNYSASSSKTKVGYTIGFGNELKVSENISLKFEYLYLDLGKRTLSSDGELGCVMDKCVPLLRDFDSDTPRSRYKLKNQFHTVKAGVNFMF